MLSVDVVYESEILPRLVLLKQHMQALQIDLVLHEQLPVTHSARVVYAPRSTNSRLCVDTDAAESIGLYFAAWGTRLPTDLSVSLPTWPARSADKAVAEFARYLHRPVVPPATPRDQASSSPVDNATHDNIDWGGVRNLTVLIALVIAATWLFERGDEAPQGADPLIESTALPIDPAIDPDPALDTQTDAESDAESVANMNQTGSARAHQARSFKQTRVTPASSHSFNSMCAASQAQVLNAVLKMQSPTDFSACIRQRQRDPISAPVSDSSTRTTTQAHSQPTKPT